MTVTNTGGSAVRGTEYTTPGGGATFTVPGTNPSQYEGVIACAGAADSNLVSHPGTLATTNVITTNVLPASLAAEGSFAINIEAGLN